MVSHDRTFLENVVTSSWVYRGNGKFEEYIGAHTDYTTDSKSTSAKPAKIKIETGNTNSVKKDESKEKLSYNQQRELNKLPAEIEKFEKKVDEIQAKLADPKMYLEENSKETLKLSQKLKYTESELEKVYSRWEQLEALR
jgi:ATP-binding cassette subfamily F protein uup